MARAEAGVIGAVAIGHDVDVGLDIGEHAAHHIALAAAGHVVDEGAGGARDRRRAVVEALSKTWMAASGSAARKPPTTLAIAGASL